MGKPGLLSEKFGVGRVGAGIAAFNVIEAEFVEHLGDQLLVMQREVDAIGLRTITQRGVEQIKPLARHFGPPASPSVFCMVVLASHSPLSETVLRCRAS